VPTFERGQKVRIAEHGIGEVQADLGTTVIVRFGNGIQECRKCDVVRIESVADALQANKSHSPLGVVLRVQAECIGSINSVWGMFARSRITLLPHQLWVCRKVLEAWPAKWLVADDVGLGKTIEAGLILSSLVSRRKLRRLLILCPASLVEQWQYRLRTMFDIRTSIYMAALDTDRSDFWNTNPQVVASLHTLRLDSQDRHQRLLHSEPWDLVIVDEAHHLNADEQTGPTLGFKLVQELVQARRVKSMVFFSGTPHRGKPFGFFSLLSLLRPGEFGPKLPYLEQLRQLPGVMIRNNKQNVTDLHGEPLFQELDVQSRTYSYSVAEATFYFMLTEFIVTGKAYASRLGGRDGRAVMLVLISMQKLASSSVAAILRALKGRLSRIGDASKSLQEVKRVGNMLKEKAEAESTGDLDTASRLDESMAEIELQLMADERGWLERLIAAAEAVEHETKITSIVSELRTYDRTTSVLFFTEYKATQSLLMSALIAEYGESAVAFINGDGEARDVVHGDGRSKTIRGKRTDTADRFNRGDVRFLVSTEAAGEGIDLQGRCHTLIHVDLPWNPMRLHQRVGRVNRYGQNEQVRVISFRNPSTVEGRIWAKLMEKIEHINNAFRRVMADPEDMYELVLGMTPPEVFRDVFAEGDRVPLEKFDAWFDRETSRFGSQDVIDTVRDLVGNCARFDFQDVSEKLPKVDLPDLEGFVSGMLIYNRRHPRFGPDGLSFKTPDEWLIEPAILPEYGSMLFDREKVGNKSTEQLLGVGHKLVDMAIDQAMQLEGCLAVIAGGKLEYPLVACRVFDRVTTGDSGRLPTVCGAELRSGEIRIIADWELLKVLNQLSPHSLRQMECSSPQIPVDILAKFPEIAAKSIAFAKRAGNSFLQPDAEVSALLISSPI
jgi:ERCC4-related helicase